MIEWFLILFLFIAYIAERGRNKKLSVKPYQELLDLRNELEKKEKELCVYMAFTEEYRKQAGIDQVDHLLLEVQAIQKLNEL